MAEAVAKRTWKVTGIRPDGLLSDNAIKETEEENIAKKIRAMLEKAFANECGKTADYKKLADDKLKKLEGNEKPDMGLLGEILGEVAADAVKEGAGKLVASGAVGVAGAILEGPGAAILSTISGIASLPFGAISAVGLGALATAKLIEYARMKQNGLTNNDARKIEADLNKFQEDLETLYKQFKADEAQLIQDYKTMGKLKFHKHLKAYVKSVMKQYDLGPKMSDADVQAAIDSLGVEESQADSKSQDDSAPQEESNPKENKNKQNDTLLGNVVSEGERPVEEIMGRA